MSEDGGSPAHGHGKGPYSSPTNSPSLSAVAASFAGRSTTDPTEDAPELYEHEKLRTQLSTEAPLGDEEARELPGKTKKSGIVRRASACIRAVDFPEKQVARLQVNSIRDVRLRDFVVSDYCAMQFCSALKVNRSARSIDVFGAKISSHGLNLILEGLHTNAFVTKLFIDDFKMDEENFKALSRLLEVNVTLHTLRLKNVGLGLQGAQHLGKSMVVNNYLRSLAITNNSVGSEGLAALFDGLLHQETESVQTLDLRRCDLLDEDYKNLSNYIENSTCLQELWLDFNRMTKPGAEALRSAMVGRQAKLQCLHLNWSKVDDDAAVALSQAVAVSDSLVSVNLDGNLITDVGFEALVKAASERSGFRILSVNNNCVTDDGIKRVAGHLILSNSLHTLNLKENLIGVEGFVLMCEVMQRNMTIRNLTLKGNKFQGIHCGTLEDTLVNSDERAGDIGALLEVVDREDLALSEGEEEANNGELHGDGNMKIADKISRASAMWHRAKAQSQASTGKVLRRLEEAQIRMKDLEAELEAVKKELASEKEENRPMKDNLKKTLHANRDLQGKLSDVSVDMESLKSENKKLLAQQEGLWTASKEFKDEITEENNALKSRAEIAERKARQLEREKGAMIEEMSASGNSATAIIRAALEDPINMAQQEMKRARKALLEMTQKKDDEILELREELDQLQLKALEAAETKRKLDAERSLYKEMKNEYKATRVALAKSRNEVAKYRRMLKENGVIQMPDSEEAWQRLSPAPRGSSPSRHCGACGDHSRRVGSVSPVPFVGDDMDMMSSVSPDAQYHQDTVSDRMSTASGWGSRRSVKSPQFLGINSFRSVPSTPGGTLAAWPPPPPRVMVTAVNNKREGMLPSSVFVIDASAIGGNPAMERRYREFVSLHHNLVKLLKKQLPPALTSNKLPDFPEKQTYAFWRRMSVDESLKPGVESYLNGLLDLGLLNPDQVPDRPILPAASKLVLKFFQLDGSNSEIMSMADDMSTVRSQRSVDLGSPEQIPEGVEDGAATPRSTSSSAFRPVSNLRITTARQVAGVVANGATPTGERPVSPAVTKAMEFLRKHSK